MDIGETREKGLYDSKALSMVPIGFKAFMPNMLRFEVAAV